MLQPIMARLNRILIRLTGAPLANLQIVMAVRLVYHLAGSSALNPDFVIDNGVEAVIVGVTTAARQKSRCSGSG